MVATTVRAQPSVTTIIPAYNAERTLAATLDSVAAQSVPPDEIILIDDSSTDGTVELARSYRDRLPQLRVIETIHGGISRTRNVGIREASGTLIAPLDADDIWHPTYIEKMTRRYREATAEPVMIYSAFRRIDLDGRILAPAFRFDVSGAIFNRMLLRNFVGNGSGMMFSRRLALAVGLYDEQRRGNEDYHLQLELAWHGPVAAVPECLVGYRDVPGSVSKHFKLMASDLLTMFEDLRREYPAIEAVPFSLATAQAHGLMARALARDGDMLGGLRHVLAAVRHDPINLPSRAVRSAARTVRWRLGWRPSRAPGPDFFAVDTTWDLAVESMNDRRFKCCAELDAQHVFPPQPELWSTAPQAEEKEPVAHGGEHGRASVSVSS
jgi:cellulose synthase/poly-beta-1,6-N-acetylglucosamine synthase-like glycosyltransferase